MPSTTDPAFTDALIDDVDTLSRRASEAADVVRGLNAHDDEHSLLVLRVRDDEHVQPVDLECYLDAPRRARGSATLHDPQDFVTYAKRIADNFSTCWADDQNRRITLVVNDHTDGAGEGGAQGWRDHGAVLQVRSDPDWDAWVAHDGKYYSQDDFADFLEDQAHAVIEPDGAEMLEIATSLHVAKSGTFSRSVDRSTGSVRLNYQDENTATAGANAQLEVPKKFTVRLTPFLGADALDIRALFRLQTHGGVLKIGFKLERPDKIARDAFESLRGNVADQLGGTPPVLIGPAPGAVQPDDPTEHARSTEGVAAVAREVRELRSQLQSTGVIGRR